MKMLKILTALLLIFNCINKVHSQRGSTPTSQENIKSQTGKTYAIIIGISKYKDIDSLKYADKDALNFRNYLINHYSPKVDSNDITMFLNEEATQENIAILRNESEKKLTKGDRLIFYFAGHGDIEESTDDGLMLLYGCPKSDYSLKWDDVLSVNATFELLKKKVDKGVEVIYIIDACHSGKLSGGIEGRRRTTTAIKNSLLNETAILSSQADQISMEGESWGGGQGLFSFYLNKGLLGWANTDNDDKINLFELENYLGINVSKQSENTQIPLITARDKRMVFTTYDKNVLLDISKNENKFSETYSYAGLKGREDRLVKSLDAYSLEKYHEFNRRIDSNIILKPYDSSAIKLFRELENTLIDHDLLPFLRRKLVSALNLSCDTIINRIINGDGIPYKPERWVRAKVELDSSLNILKPDHLYYNVVLSKRYFIEGLIIKDSIRIDNYTSNDKKKMLNAISKLKLAKDLEPKAGYIHYILGLTYQDMYENDSSLVYLSRFLKLIPKSHVAHDDIGVALYDNGYEEEGISAIKKSIELKPDFIEAISNLAYIYHRTGRYRESIEVCLNGIKIKPDKAALYGNIAKAYEGLLMLDSVEYYLLKMLDLAKNKYYPLKELAFFYKHINEYTKAEKYAKLSIENNPKGSEPFFILGHLSHCSGNYNLALQELYRGKINDENDYSVLRELAWVYKSLGIVDSSSLYFNWTINIYKSYKEIERLCTINLGIANMYMYGISDQVKAQEHLDLAIKYDSSNVEAWAKKVINQINLDENDQAEQTMKKLNEIAPENVWTHFANSILLFNMGKNEAALRLIEKVLEKEQIPIAQIKYEKKLEDFMKKYPDVFSKYFKSCKCKT